MMTAKPDGDFRAQLAGFSLTTAEILYRLPDHPSLLQSYIWQEYDVHPRFPRLRTFLDFWSRNLEGKLYRVTVAHKKLITPAEMKLISGDYRLNLVSGDGKQPSRRDRGKFLWIFRETNNQWLIEYVIFSSDFVTPAPGA